MTSCHGEVVHLSRVGRHWQIDLNHSLKHEGVSLRRPQMARGSFIVRLQWYDPRMRTETKKSPLPLVFALLAGALALIFLFAFQGWIAHGADIFLSLAEAGLSWCF